MAGPSECEARHHNGEVRANAVLGDKVLSAIGGKGKGLSGSADQAIPRSPAIVRGFAFLGHFSALPVEKGNKRVCRDQRSPAATDGPQFLSGYGRIQGSFAEACSCHRLADRIGEFRRVVCIRVHNWLPCCANGGVRARGNRIRFVSGSNRLEDFSLLSQSS